MPLDSGAEVSATCVLIPQVHMNRYPQSIRSKHMLRARMGLGVDTHGSRHHHPPMPHRWTSHEPQWSTAQLRSAGTVRRATLVLRAESTRGHSPGPLNLAPSRLHPAGNTPLDSTAWTTGSRCNGGSLVDARGGWVQGSLGQGRAGSGLDRRAGQVVRSLHRRLRRAGTTNMSLCPTL